MDSGTIETTAGEVSRNFGQWQDRALQSPVTVTHHGRPRVVIVSVETFERMKTGGGEGAGLSTPGVEAESGTALNALLKGMTEGFIALDSNLRITAANAVVEAFLGCSASDIVGRPMSSIIHPGRAEIYIERYRWVLRTGEVADFEASSHFKTDRMICLRAFPYRGGVGIIFTNLTELIALRGEQAEWRATRAALDAHDQVARADIDLYGFVTAANPSFREFVGFGPAQLTEVRLSDLVAASSRQTLAAGLSRLLKQEIEVFGVELDFLTRDQGRRGMRLSIAPRRHNFTFEGFSVIALPVSICDAAA